MKRRQQQILIAIVSGISILMLIGVFIFWTSKIKLETYRNSQFKIGYPKTWSMVENQSGVAAMFFSPKEGPLDAFTENMNIVVQDISSNPMDLQQYSDIAITQMRAVFKDEMQIVKSEPFFFAGRMGYKLVYTGKNPGGDIKFMHVWTIKDNIAYQITYSALVSSFDRFLPTAEKMIRSFKIH